MSTSRSIPILMSIAAIAPQARAGSDETRPAREILAKVDARFGDPAARKKLRTLVMRGSVEYPECSGGEIKQVKGRIEETWLAPDRVRSNVEWNKNFWNSGSAGAFTWSHDGVGVVIQEGDEQGPMQRLFDLGRRASWQEMYESGETTGTEELDELGGRPHFVISMKPAAGAADTWFVDGESFELGAIETTLLVTTGGECKVRFYFSDFRDVNGIRFPFSKVMKLGADPTRFVHQYEKIEVGAAVKPEQVEPSAEVIAALKDPTKRVLSPSDDPTECAIEVVTAQTVLSIRVKVAPDDVSKTLATLYPEVIGALTEVGGEMTGLPYCRIHSTTKEAVDLEAGIPIRKKVAGKGRVTSTELPAGRMAVTWHVGSYDTVAKSQERLAAWIESQSLETVGGHWEVYWTDPGIEPDPAKHRTRIFWPIK